MVFDDEALEQRLVARTGDDQRVRRAIAFARHVHAGALRDEGTPYIAHPLRVALTLVDELAVADTDLICAALLHDTIEDDPTVTCDSLRAAFGPSVAHTVSCLTDEFKQSGLPRVERRERYLARIARADEPCLLVKLCDRIDNLRSLRYVTDAEKKARMKRETETYLVPALANRPPPFPELGRLIDEALCELDLPVKGTGDVEP
jgi:guanosine-3',5'-bis(diphosphate) 3'-pyrophosphohydrolase